MKRSRVAALVAVAGLLAVLCACGSDSQESSEPAEPTTAATDAGLDEDLRDELVDMAALDQAVRGGPPPEGMTADEVPTIDEVDAANQSRIVEIFDDHGWPGWSLVGHRGSTAAWLVVQHADLDLALQRRGLALLRTAVEDDDASTGDLAYLTDRVLVAQGRPQVYGTQWEPTRGGAWVPRTPIARRATVDDRRAEAGLGPLAAYVDELEAAGRRS